MLMTFDEVGVLFNHAGSAVTLTVAPEYAKAKHVPGFVLAGKHLQK